MAKVLVVEDDLDVCAMLELVLTSDGHEVRIASNGEEGIRLVHTDKPDVAILDIEMPIMSGPGMVLRLFAIDCGIEEIPIIFMSGHVDLDKVAKEFGTPYKLAKPFEIEDLLALTNRASRERKIPQPIVRNTSAA